MHPELDEIFNLITSPSYTHIFGAGPATPRGPSVIMLYKQGVEFGIHRDMVGIRGWSKYNVTLLGTRTILFYKESEVPWIARHASCITHHTCTLDFASAWFEKMERNQKARAAAKRILVRNFKRQVMIGSVRLSHDGSKYSTLHGDIR